MARPREFDHEEAVDAALRQFWREGYGRTNVNDLASCMGISRSSFYNSFGDRESLFLEALSEYARQAPDFAFFAIEAGQPVLPAIRNILYKLCVVRSDPDSPKGCFAVNAIAELGESEPRLSDILKGMLERKVSILQKLYRQARKQGEIAADANEKLLADETMLFICGLNLVSNLIQDRHRLWSMAREFMLRTGFPADVVAGKAAK
jgi:TetR/AcrR family transcriptional repressor of nem operon